jgi:hypothetical protein
MTKTLTSEDINFLNKILQESKYSIFTKKDERKIFESLGLTAMSVKHRAFKVNLEYTFGYEYLEVDKNTPGKANVCMLCSVCKKEHIMTNIRYQRRSYTKEPLCGIHYRKFITDSDEWKKRNSNAQKIAQGREETKEKNRISQKRRHLRPETKLRYHNIGVELWKNEEYREKVSSGLRKKWEDSSYADKVLQNSKMQYHGTYSGMKYQSLVELAFILWCESNNIQINRYNLGPVKYGENKNYYPDFIINKDIIVEVKGSPDGFMKQRSDEILEKRKALQTFCKNTKYKERIVYKKDLPKDFYKEARKKHAEITKKNLS